MISRFRPIAVFLFLAVLVGASHASDEDRSGVQQWGVLSGYGTSSRDGIFMVPLMGRAAWLLPEMIDEPLRRHDLNLKWVVEGWVAAVFDGQDAFEGGINPIVLKLDYDRGQRLVPFGICLLYTSPSPRDKRQSRMPSSA